MALIETDQLEKKYEVGDSIVHALDNVSLRISAG
jgi:ABC-type oligopeptide transport system ATPase subunit